MKIANHYLPQCHLKRWESSPKKILLYRTLVSHENVPLWRECSVKGIAYRSYLYARVITEGLSDKTEIWLDQEYEAPAEEVLERVVAEARLTRSDWKILIRFLAAQRVRTPARLFEMIERHEKTLPEILEDTLQEAAQQLESAKSNGANLQKKKSLMAEYLPINVKIESDPVKKIAVLKAETVTGRGLWIFAMRHLLTKTANVLHQHKWTILSPPDGIRWLTSDDPVIQLNWNNQKYTFGGGWGSAGTEIFLPISPQHLLYTQVGKRPPLRGTRIQLDMAQMINRFIAEHAHRMIFASEPDTTVEKYRPREVDSERFSDEKSQWAKWHENQTDAERELMGWSG